MKKLIPLFIIIALMASCKSSSKQLEGGNYDAALKKSAKKIKKNPSKFEEVDVFNQAYRMANERDNATLDRLKRQGNPANWSSIYSTLVRMNSRQDLAISLPPVGIEFTERDYYNEINDARLKAAEYSYALGVKLLKKDDRFSARKAFDSFKEAKGFETNFKDVDIQIANALFKGTTNVFFKIEDNSKVVAPKGLIEEIQRVNVDELDKGWINYETYIDSNLNYHYSVILNLKLIDVSPETLKETTYTESKEIQDGFDYVLDQDGNVKKDSLGNDIKIVRYKTISCSIKEFYQKKTARVSGTIDYFDNANGKLMKSEPIASDAIFEHFYAIANGNLGALKPETQKKIGIDPLPFPRDEPLILQAGDVLKGMTKEILDRNKSFLK
jgi:hypothetical protein